VGVMRPVDVDGTHRDVSHRGPSRDPNQWVPGWHTIRPEMSRIPAKKTKHTKPTRQEILKGIGWKPLEAPPGVPADVVEAENRRMQDGIVGWAQGLAAHIDKYEQTQEAARQSDHRPKCLAASVQVEIDPASDVGAMMAELRGAIDPADLAGKGNKVKPGITVRDGISGSDLDRLRHYLRSLDPFEIKFGAVNFL